MVRGAFPYNHLTILQSYILQSSPFSSISYFCHPNPNYFPKVGQLKRVQCHWWQCTLIMCRHRPLHIGGHLLQCHNHQPITIVIVRDNDDVQFGRGKLHKVLRQPSHTKTWGMERLQGPKGSCHNIWSSPPRVPLTASWIWIMQHFDVIITIVAVIFILQIGIFVLRNFTFIFVTTIIIITWTNFSQRYSGMKPAQSGSPSYPRYLSSDLIDCNLTS